MSRREPLLLLGDIVESIQKIQNYTHGFDSHDFVQDEKTIDAVIRNFEIIGEAANRLPDEVKDAYPQVNWHRIRGFRNRIVHDYMGVDLDIIWKIITSDLEDLRKNIQGIMDVL